MSTKNEITKNEIRFSSHYIGSKEIVKVVNFNLIEERTDISQFNGNMQTDKISSDGKIHLLKEYELYLGRKSAALLPMTLDLTMGEINRAIRFYSADEWFENSILSKEDREELIKQYDEIKKEKQRPRMEEKNKRRNERRRVQYGREHASYKTGLSYYDYKEDIAKYGSAEIETKF